MGWQRRRFGLSWTLKLGVVVGVGAAGLATLPPAFADTGATASGADESVIVEFGPNAGNALDLIHGVARGASVTQVFDSIPAVAIKARKGLVDALQAAGASVIPDEPVNFQSKSGATSCPSFSGTSSPSGIFSQDTGANLLAAQGDTGQGVTVAVLDTGIDGALPDFAGRLVGGVDLTPGNSPFTDEFGHGTFVAGLVAGNGASSNGQYPGEAPGANLVSIKVAGADGQTSISTVVSGIQWAIKNQKKYGINILNLSLGAVPTGPTATEPMDQAIEQAWQSGITVVVAAGNSGPSAGTITSPGDDPLAITAGAYADNNSPSPSDWYACPFSSVGPSLYDGWLKPDLVAPGRSVISLLAPGSTIAQDFPHAHVGTGNFVGSGTSFSAGITSGAAALVLARNPGISPDQVKGRLLGNAMPGETQAPLIEGHGFLNAYYAAISPSLTYSQTAAAAAETSNPPSTINLGTSWSPSSWNQANWTGSSWTGAAWNGSSWTGATWNGSSWTGSSWTGSSWTGSSWTGSAWTGSAWTGSAWTGSAWTGSSWTGSSWTGSSWTGSSWTGSSWTGSSWTGSSWTGSSWTDFLWT
ncbi:MAG TPA: S8 family serine peptidase [Acidimicrobiales bacterium]